MQATKQTGVPRQSSVRRSATVAPPPARAPRSGFLARLFNAYQPIANAYEWIARREMLACATVLFLTLGLRAAILPWRPPPPPSVVDEFSYLLGADTFASGRVANPPHPMWQHFETFHELMQPAYASKYPPMQSLVMAFGQKLFGDPWYGVFLSAGLMCATLCWMLQGWLTPNLAFLGGLLAVLRFGPFSYWMNSYWGGAVPAIGGALLLGALPRLWRHQKRVDFIVLACGLVVLMHSRPWEGCVLALAALGVLVWRLAATGSLVPLKLLRTAAPAIAILLLSFGAVGYLDYRLTGNALLMPHVLYSHLYMPAPDFAFQTPGPTPEYRHAEIRGMFLGGSIDVWREAHDHFFAAILQKLTDIYDFFFGFRPLMLIPLLWPYRLKTVEERIAVFLLVVFLVIAIFPEAGFMLHYAAPVAGLLYVRFLQTLARWSKWRPSGRPLGAIAGAIFVALFGLHFATSLAIRLVPGGMPDPPFAVARSEIVKSLAAQPGQQLVLVRYSPRHIVDEEWVWNRADIDGSQTVWARAMDPEKDRELIRYYRGRQVWTLNPDQFPLQLVPYSDSGPPQ